MAVTLLLAVAWAVSGWWWYGREQGSTRVVLQQGAVRVSCGALPWVKLGPTWIADRLPRGETHWRWRTQTPAEAGRTEGWNAWVVATSSYTIDGVAFQRVYAITTVQIELWPAVLLGGALSGRLLWVGLRAKGRVRRGCCSACGYSRSGIAESAPCPECGGRHV